MIPGHLCRLKSAKADFVNFYRDETSNCSEQVIFGDSASRDLPAFKSTAVESAPGKARRVHLELRDEHAPRQAG